MGPERSIPELLDVISSDSNHDARIGAAEELAERLDPDAVRELASLAAGNERAAEGLGVVRDSLILFYDERESAADTDRRLLIVRGLAEIDDERSAETLPRILVEDSDAGISDLASDALRTMPSPSKILGAARRGPGRHLLRAPGGSDGGPDRVHRQTRN